MARKKTSWCVLFSTGADKKSAADGVIVIDVRYDEKTVRLYPYTSREGALLGEGKRADNRVFLSREGAAAVVDELSGIEIGGRYLNGSDMVSYIVSCRERYGEEELLRKIRELVSTVGHKARAVDLQVLAEAAKRSLRFISHDLSALRMLGLVGELKEIMKFTFCWGS